MSEHTGSRIVFESKKVAEERCFACGSFIGIVGSVRNEEHKCTSQFAIGTNNIRLGGTPADIRKADAEYRWAIFKMKLNPFYWIRKIMGDRE